MTREQIAALDAALLERWRELHRHADESDGTGEHVGFARHYRAKADGIWEALVLVRCHTKPSEPAP